jgi:4-diphosphocytidyl-2C-methyl-D-erythritol kinase
MTFLARRCRRQNWASSPPRWVQTSISFYRINPRWQPGAANRWNRWQPFPPCTGKAFFLFHPGFGISTPWAYQNLARFPEALNGRKGRAHELATGLQAGNLAAAAAGFYNSLEAPALAKFPVLKLYQEFLMASGAVVSLMSGSGSTTFAIAENMSAADRLAEKFKARFGTQGWMAVVPI